MNQVNKNGFNDDEFSFGNRERAGQEDENDLKQAQERINRTENESLESTARALRMLNETEEVGIKTASELNAQGEQLRNIDSKLDEVDHTLSATQKNINSMKSMFSGFFSRNKDKKAPAKKQQSAETLTSSNSTGKLMKGGDVNPKPEFAVITGSDREQEMNSNLDQMSQGLSRLGDLAKGMSFELDRQNPMLDRLQTKTEKNHVRIDAQNDQMKKLLK